MCSGDVAVGVNVIFSGGRALDVLPEPFENTRGLIYGKVSRNDRVWLE